MSPSSSTSIVRELVSDIRDKYAYCPETGIVTWKVPHAKHFAKPGDRAGSKNREGYWYLRYGGKNVAVHRFAWLVMTGGWPEKTIDHKNCDPSDNRWENLREATQSQNCANRRYTRQGRFLRGVRLAKNGRYFATITHKRRLIYLGTFDTQEAAFESYTEAVQRLRGEFARLG